MSQSPIRLQSVIKKSGFVDALPLSQPKRLFECLYKSREQVNGCFEGEKGHANFVVAGNGPLIRFRGADYQLKKIHVHAQSEHIIEQDDKHDMEMHFVHAPLGSSVDAPLVVIGVLFTKKEGDSRRSNISKAFDKLRESADSNVCISIRPLDLFPQLQIQTGSPDTINWFHYEGSLTSFPYSENVSWIVMNATAKVSSASIESLVQHAEQEQREIQPLKNRIVVRSFLVNGER